MAEQSRVIAEALGAAPGITVRIVWQPVVAGADAIRRLCLAATATTPASA